MTQARRSDGLPVLVECLVVIASLCLLGIGYCVGRIWFHVLEAARDTTLNAHAPVFATLACAFSTAAAA